LPVCEADGTVLGVVDVMDVIYGCGGIEGWRSVFNSTLDLEDTSDTASAQSGRGSTGGSHAKSVRSKKSTGEPAKDVRPVSKLRPKKPLIASTHDTVLAVTQMLASKRGDAALLVSDDGALAGIITDTDVTRRLVAKHLDASETTVSNIMTKNPTCVSMSDSAMDAMSTMVENHFRHLPVIDDTGAVAGLLDIAKCLNDAISKLEKI
jgi:signal-transduction protein with cAMP-binding, CBS, and nucleotidyltransferase domain